MKTSTVTNLSARIREQNQQFHYLSLLLLASHQPEDRQQALQWFASLSEGQTTNVLDTADMHHVIVRAFSTLQKIAAEDREVGLADWTLLAVAAEQERARKAVIFLNAICEALGAAGHPVMVIKSLEHWPDLGSDLDLFTSAEDQTVVSVMSRRFHAHLLNHSWADRLAHKWNFKVPGLREPVEVHVARLGQTGEHVELAQRVAQTSIFREVHSCSFRTPSAEGSIILATLQRMYRHFYLRLCDMVDAVTLLETRGVNFPELRAIAEPAGIWPGVATYLKIVSDYWESYRGCGLDLPPEVIASARFGGEKLFCRGNFLRIPIFWQGAKLYSMQMAKAASLWNLPAVLRLSLLPCLGAAAALEYKATGTDKGVW